MCKRARVQSDGYERRLAGAGNCWFAQARASRGTLMTKSAPLSEERIWGLWTLPGARKAWTASKDSANEPAHSFPRPLEARADERGFPQAPTRPHVRLVGVSDNNCDLPACAGVGRALAGPLSCRPDQGKPLPHPAARARCQSVRPVASVELERFCNGAARLQLIDAGSRSPKPRGGLTPRLGR